jgi:hypothetical protein
MAKSYNSAFAWWYLSREQKDALEDLRRRGHKEFGGMGDKAPYFYVQEGSEIEMQMSAAKAGIQPKLFVLEALEAGRLSSGEIYDILAST